MLTLAKDLQGTRGGGPPIIPSSGVTVSVKLRRSVGSGKWVRMVDGRSSSVKSGKMDTLSLCQTEAKSG